MKLKSLFVWLIVLMLFAQTQGIASAQGPTLPSPSSWDDVVKRYGLKSVDVVPAGVTPMAFTSPAHLDAFLSNLKRQSQVSPHVNYFEREDLNLLPMSVTYAVVTRSCSVTVGLAKFNTWADIRVGHSGSFRWINSVLNTRTGLTGVTLGFTLTNDYSYAYNQTATSVSVKGGGIVNAYLVIEGGILLFSTPVSCSFTYSVY